MYVYIDIYIYIYSNVFIFKYVFSYCYLCISSHGESLFLPLRDVREPGQPEFQFLHLRPLLLPFAVHATGIVSHRLGMGSK